MTGGRIVSRVRKAAERVGGTLDEDCLDEDRLVVDAPAGFVWRATGSESLVMDAAPFGQNLWTEIGNEILEQIAQGLKRDE